MFATACLLVLPLVQTTVRPMTAIESRTRPDVPKYSIEQLFATRQIGGCSWSPDGERVVMVTNISGRHNLWIVPAAGGWPVQLTTSDQRQLAPAWSPHGRWIAFQSDRDANEEWDIFVVSPRTGEVVNLTDSPGVSEEDPIWSPDSRLLAAAVKPVTAPNYEIELIDVATRTRRAVTKGTPPDWSLALAAFVPGGKQLLATRTHASGKDADVVLVDLATGALRVLTPHQGEQLWTAFDVSPDGSHALVTSNARNGFENIALLDLAAAPRGGNGAAPVTWVTDERHEMSAGNFSPDGRWLTYEANVDGYGELYAFEPGTGRREKLALEPGFNSWAGRPTSYSPDGARVLVRRSAADSPGDLLAWDLDAASVTRLTQAFVAGVDPGDMVAPRSVRYRSRDGLEVHAFLYVPWNLERDGTHPAIVWVHGGPTAQSVAGFTRQVQYLVNHGYVVLEPNYRGSTGYGKSFMDANRFDMGGGDLADVVAGAQFLEGTGYVDAAKIAVGGGSYGGYLTMMAVTKEPQRWAAGVAMFPFVNWFTELEHEDPLLRQYDLATMGDPGVEEARYRERSPIFFVDRIRAPLMLLAGGNDPRCPPDESRQVEQAMKRAGRTCEFLLYEDEGHGFARLENLFEAWRKIVAFLERELKGAKTATR